MKVARKKKNLPQVGTHHLLNEIKPFLLWLQRECCFREVKPLPLEGKKGEPFEVPTVTLPVMTNVALSANLELNPTLSK